MSLRMRPTGHTGLHRYYTNPWRDRPNRFEKQWGHRAARYVAREALAECPDWWEVGVDGKGRLWDRGYFSRRLSTAVVTQEEPFDPYWSWVSQEARELDRLLLRTVPEDVLRAILI